MNIYYNDYINGKESEVYDKLCNLGDRLEYLVDKDELELLRNEIAKRIKINFEIIYSSLEEINYVFYDFEVPSNHNSVFEVVTNSSNDILKLDIYKDTGLVPFTFECVYSAIKSVDFRGYFKDWSSNILLDPIYFDPINYIIEGNEFDNLLMSDDGIPYLYFSPDEYIKENISGVGGYGIPISKSRHFDGLLINYGSDIFFMDYLKLCFKWAGFPGLEWAEEGDVSTEIIKYVKSVNNRLIKI